MSRAINYREIKRRYEAEGPQKTVKHFREALEEKHLKPEDFSIRELAEAMVGHEWVKSMDPRRDGSILEAGDAVDSTAFSNITGQIIVNKVLEGYQQPSFVLSSLIPNVPTRLSGEKIPGIGGLSDSGDALKVGEGMPYPNAGVSEDYIETPATDKRGLTVAVTKEAVYFDLTGQVLTKAGQVGEVLGMNKEKRLAAVAAGITNNYKWKGTAYDTYQASTPWVNVVSSNELIDWTDIDAAEQLFAAMSDPTTGEPVMISAPQVVVMPAYRHAANRILNATEIRYTGSSAPTQTLAPNPLSGYTPYSSAVLYRRIVASGVAAADAAKWWFIGDFRKAFAYMENWPITVTQAPSNSEAEFERDIVARFKASERGVAAVMDPRYIVKCYQS